MKALANMFRCGVSKDNKAELTPVSRDVLIRFADNLKKAEVHIDNAVGNAAKKQS